MGKNSDRERQRRLEEQQAEDRRRQTELIAAAAQPKPVEAAFEREQLDWLDATSGKNGPLDIYNLRQLKPSLALYDAASARQKGERMGIGALRFGADNTNPMLTQALREQQDAERQQAAAGQLENAYRLTDAQMRGSVLPLLSLQQNRSMGLASLASNNAANSTQAWANFRPAPSFWRQLLLTGVGGAAQVGAAFAGRPG